MTSGPGPGAGPHPGPRLGPRTLHLHAGLPKTASTWLQEQAFARLAHLEHRPVPRSRLLDAPRDRAQGGRLMAAALRRSPRVWEAMGEALMAELLGPRAPWLASGRDLLISDEAIGRLATRPDALAHHLRAMAPLARRWGLERLSVLVLVRRQDRWLASHYAQLSDRLPRASQRGFETMARRVADPRAERHGFGMLLDYAALHQAAEPVVRDPALGSITGGSPSPASWRLWEAVAAAPRRPADAL